MVGRRHLCEVNVTEVSSMLVVTVRENNASNLPSFKVVNRTPDLRLRFRQQHTDPLEYPVYVLQPAEYTYFSWDNPNLPKAIELCAVDDFGFQSNTVVYRLENVDDRMQPISVGNLHNRRTALSVREIVEGRTRVLIVSSEAPSVVEAEEHESDVTSLLRMANVDIFFKGLALSLVDDRPRELVSVTLEEITCRSLRSTSQWHFSLYHFQVLLRSVCH